MRDQLEIARRGWPDAGPWERCTWAACPGNVEHPGHVYAVIEDCTPHLHMHVHIDIEHEVLTILHIGKADDPDLPPLS